MKLKKSLTAAAAILAVSLTAAAFGFTLADNYSTSDPLISKSYLDNVFLGQITSYVDTKLTEVTSYVDTKLAEVTSYVDTKMTEVKSYVDTKLAEVASSADTEVTELPSPSTSYEIITLYNGQALYATESMEFILRPGSSATVVSPIPENGIADLTSGTELYNGAPVPINAYCLIPRGDGRGIICTSEAAYIMVRGAYEIK